MKSLREKLKDIERHSYNSTIDMVALVRQNYEKVLARKTKEFEHALKLIKNEKVG